jgi:hypothetical protein
LISLGFELGNQPELPVISIAQFFHSSTIS